MRPPRLLVALTGAAAVGLVGVRAARAAAPSVRLSGAGGTAPAPDRPRTRHTPRAWAELLRVSALFTVPGDALAGAAAAGRSPGRGTALAVGASLCLYEAGMALNDWADRDEDAVDRPHRPIPSGRIAPGAALAAAGALTAAGLALAARAGRPALTVATGLAATVWAYDLRLKHTPAGPAAMATARALDLLLGAVATGDRDRPAGGPVRWSAAASAGPLRVSTSGSRSVAVSGSGSGSVAVSRSRSGSGSGSGSSFALGSGAGSGAHRRRDVGARASGRRSVAGYGPAVPAALVLGAHTYAVTAVSRHEARGGSTAVPLASLAATAALGAAVVRGHMRPPGAPSGLGARGAADPCRGLLLTALTGAYLRTAGPPLLHAALNPSPPLTQRAVGGGIRAMIPLQAALAARAGAPLTGLAVMGLAPLARTLARKVSPT
ncbi:MULTISPECIES: SCO3242 family prenyltransferase [unclassified Streptomyces]|uniref:SCO3242 family prenyltransferase n=1 Tax=unclassified Streptomyces TaxID=2593676 RepID=UPI00081B3265|nr:MULTISPECIES: UbiA family prenyltransferase [unclassified Streptomyces]MYQ53550.1 prenyltransferase [Streptomyces sp. SID4941]SCE07397.1 4-hydroxybenzoate polyprenyltransferase [Streptomyces sp. PalvLS-984]SDB98289.1 4-hydroxybenzoate polyprenyltransferase [Streptomyces sp. AmelKG-A3]